MTLTQAFDNLVSGIPVTLELTGLSFCIGLLGGIPLVLMLRSSLAVVRAPVVFVVDLVRAVPVIAWLFLVYYGLAQDVVQLDPFPAASITLGAVMSAIMAEIYRSGLLAVHHGQWEAAQALGFGRVRTYTDVIAPQALRAIVPPAAGALIALLKDTAIASTIGVSDITYLARQETQESFEGLTVFGVAALIYIALSLPLGFLSRRLDQRLQVGFVR